MRNCNIPILESINDCTHTHWRRGRQAHEALNFQTHTHTQMNARMPWVFPRACIHSMCSFFCVIDVDTENICHEQNANANRRSSALIRVHTCMYRTRSSAARRYGTRIISIHMSCQRRCRAYSIRLGLPCPPACPSLLILNTRMLMVLFWFARTALIMLSAKLFEASKSMRQQQRRIHVTFHCRTIIIIVVKRYITWCHGE